MGVPKLNRRTANRKKVTPISIGYISSMMNLTKITRNCEIIQASSSGILVRVKRESLVLGNLRKNLSLDSLVGVHVFMHLDQMNLDISGIIKRTQLGGKKDFLIAIDYSDDSPEYWRECLIELLPSPGEIEGT